MHNAGELNLLLVIDSYTLSAELVRDGLKEPNDSESVMLKVQTPMAG